MVSVSALLIAGFGGVLASAATTPTLGSASTYAVLAGSTLTNTGPTLITGDVGIAPGTSLTGFPPGTVSGATNLANTQSQAAQTSATAAYLSVAGAPPTATVANVSLGGLILTPGVYSAATSLSLTGAVTLNAGGNASAVFIFQAGSTLTTATSSSVVLINGAQACNVFWQVGSSATLGTSTSFAGTILALTTATLDTGATVSGRVLAQTGAVTLDDNQVAVPTCSTATTTTTTTPVTTTTTPVTTTTTTPVTTTTTPVVTTTTTPVTTTTTPHVPLGAPKTGFGGAAGPSSPMPLLIGIGAFFLAVLAGTAALRSRRR